MDWVVLVLVVGLVLLPVVALAGFSGCDIVFGLHLRPINPPSGLVATAIGTDRIALSWTDNSATGTDFRIRRMDDPAQGFRLIQSVTATVTTWEDSDGLVEGAYYEYQVFAVVDGNESVGSNVDGERTLQWIAALDVTPNPALDGPDRGRNCLVQRIPGSLLSLAGSAVRITLRGSGAGNLLLDATFLSYADPSGEPWDSEAQPVPVLYRGGSAGVLLASTLSERSDVIPFDVVPGKDLLVSFDIGGAGALRRRTGAPGAQAFTRVNTVPPQAGQRNRTGLRVEPDVNTVFVVEKIEVLVKVPD